MKFIDLPAQDRLTLLSGVQIETGMSIQAIEKDWWVTEVLRAIFSLPYAMHASFKGGTSLSKCWKLIDRFSEDIDIAIDREFLGFAGQLSKNQISDKLRRAACSFVRESMQNDLRYALLSAGIPESEFRIEVDITPITTTDPETIKLFYNSLVTDNQYIKPAVLIEIGGRSMTEPIELVSVNSFVYKAFPSAAFAQKDFEVRTVSVKRTFLEKICLLHEEFSKPSESIRVNRMSRHLYDVRQDSKSRCKGRPQRP